MTAISTRACDGSGGRLDFDRVAFIDLEASGLGSASFPTEIGWAIVRWDGSIESGSCLIRPVAKWTIYANAWSDTAERLTGITRDMLDRDGMPPSEAVARLIAAVRGRDMHSDQPDFDEHWLTMLFNAAEVPVGNLKLGNAARLVDQAGAVLEFDGPSAHRAESNARQLAEAVAMLFLPGKEQIRVPPVPYRATSRKSRLSRNHSSRPKRIPPPSITPSGGWYYPHLETKFVLRDDRIAFYSRLRGYENYNPDQHQHHHDWRVGPYAYILSRAYPGPACRPSGVDDLYKQRARLVDRSAPSRCRRIGCALGYSWHRSCCFVPKITNVIKQ